MSNKFFLAGLLFIIIGMGFILYSLIIYSIPPTGNANVTGGAIGCIIVFFIPICFGVGDKNIVSILLVFAALMTILVILISIYFYRKIIYTH